MTRDSLINVLRARKEKCEREATPDEECIKQMLGDIHDLLYFEGTERYQLFTLDELLKRYPHAFFSNPGRPGEIMSPFSSLLF